MLGPVHLIPPAPIPAPHAALVRIVIQPRVLRVIEDVCVDPFCRDALDCCPLPTPIPLDCYLEERNTRENAAFTYSVHLSNAPRPEAPPPAPREDSFAEPASSSRPPMTHDRPLDPAIRGPRLGDVSPAEPVRTERRVQTVHRITIPLGSGNRIDLIG